MHAAPGPSLRQGHLVPEPCLFDPTHPATRPSIFTVTKTLFGFDLRYTHWRRNGVQHTRSWHASSLSELAILLDAKVEEKVRNGHVVVPPHQMAALTIPAPKPCMVYRLNTAARSAERVATLPTHMLQYSCDYIKLRNDLKTITHMAEDSESIIVKLVTPTQWPALNKALRSIFMRDRTMLKIVFSMEDDGIIFLGDLVQLNRSQIDFYTRSDVLTDKFTAYLNGRHLSLNMVIRRWPRPPTFGISM